ncbi:uncharacterized protein LOC116300243 [Actinia tenebrosa]|uniref:Uncharacterized protein LOC116300243 n=1 Tax=Actinia tenebrosa TaxID=6105 RepID=A0A6P8IBZ3_ACTTE|nr:uncharacterized protein LOC116300243 [Actinia tenebrosa]
MANRLSATKIRLPPIDSSIHDLVTGLPIKSRNSEKRRNVLDRKKGIQDHSVIDFPPIVQPPSLQQFGSYERRKPLRNASVKMTHIEKIPTQFPGKKFAVLPPIGGSQCQEQKNKRSDENPSVQPCGTIQESVVKRRATKKAESTDSRDSNELNPNSAVNKSKQVLKRQISVLGLANIDRKQGYKVVNNGPSDESQTLSTSKKKPFDKSSLNSLTNAEIFQPRSDLQDDDNVIDDDDDDDDSTMMKLSEVLQFLEWSSELREFLNGKNSSRRNATCTGIDPMLTHAVDVIRDMLLRQTMEELCMMW